MFIKGIVVKGKQRGKSLGFPTANISVQNSAEEGIYISKTKVKDIWLNSLTFVGVAKSFNESSFQAESYIFSFDQDLYGQEIEIELIKKIRDNKKFDTIEELVEQMKKDRVQAEKYFSK